MAEQQYLRCKDPFATTMHGYPEVVGAGQVLAVDDDLVRGHEAHFEPVNDVIDRQRELSSLLYRGSRPPQQQSQRPVEQATAAPGEARPVRLSERVEDDEKTPSVLGQERPADYAPKSAWVVYAQEVDPNFTGDFEEMTKRELIEKYG